MKKATISILPSTVLAAMLAVSSAHSIAADLPAECDSYLEKLNACVNNKANASNFTDADARSVRQTLESVRQQWSEVTDKAALAQACKQANDDVLPQITKKLGCD